MAGGHFGSRLSIAGFLFMLAILVFVDEYLGGAHWEFSDLFVLMTHEQIEIVLVFIGLVVLFHPGPIRRLRTSTWVFVAVVGAGLVAYFASSDAIALGAAIVLGLFVKYVTLRGR